MHEEPSHQALLDDLSDERPEAFASLKKLLKGPPAAKQWRRLCEELKRWTDCEPQTFEALLCYIKAAISPWHRHFELTIPAPWFARLQQDKPCPELMLIESLELPAMWEVRSYAQNARYLSSLRSLRHEQLTALNESSLVTMLQQLKLPALKLLKLSCGYEAVAEQELELLSVLATLELPSLEELSITQLYLSGQTLEAWLNASWAPGLKRLTLASPHITLDHMRQLFEAVQAGQLDPELHLGITLHENDYAPLFERYPQAASLNMSFIYFGYGYDYTEPSDPYEDLYLDENWE